MSIKDKTTLKSYFETGDAPSEQNFIDVFDSMQVLDADSGITVTGGANVSGTTTSIGPIILKPSVGVGASLGADGSNVLLLNPTSVAGVNIYGHTLPSSNGSWDLGSSSVAWRDLNLTGDANVSGNLTIGNATWVDTGTYLDISHSVKFSGAMVSGTSIGWQGSYQTMRDTYALNWVDVGTWYGGTADLGLIRESAGVLRVTNGSSNGYGDIIAGGGTFNSDAVNDETAFQINSNGASVLTVQGDGDLTVHGGKIQSDHITNTSINSALKSGYIEISAFDPYIRINDITNPNPPSFRIQMDDEHLFIADETTGATVANAHLAINSTSGTTTFGGDTIVSSGNRVYLDGGIHTYLVESSSDVARWYVGGAPLLEITEDTTANKVKLGYSGEDVDFEVWANSGIALNINNSTGNATFSGDLTAGGTGTAYSELNTGYMSVYGNTPRINFYDNAGGLPQDDWYVGVENDTFVINNISDGRNDIVIDGDGQVTINTMVNVVSTAVNAELAFQVNTGEGTSLTINGDKQVGIGFSTTPSADTLLQVGGDAGITGKQVWRYAGGASGAAMSPNTNYTTLSTMEAADGFILSGGSYLNFQTYNGGWQDRMRIDSDGKVGIGTDTPNTALHLAGNTSSDYLQVDTGLNFQQVTAPTALTPTLQANVAGNIDVGDHRYIVSYLTDLGETGRGTTSDTITVTAGSQQIELTDIPTSSDYRVTGRQIYRTKASESIYSFYPLVTLNDNTTTTYMDNVADANLGTKEGQGIWGGVNTTNDIIKLNGTSVLTIDQYLTLFGYQAGAAGAYGGGNVLYGAYAGNAITSGANNTCMGGSAGNGTTTENGNTFIGQASGLSCAGGYNAALGYATLYTTNGSYNVCMGYNAGRYSENNTDLTTINNCVLLGSHVETKADSASNEIVIGYNAVGNGSNTATLGSDAITNTYLKGDTTITGAVNVVSTAVNDETAFQINSNGASVLTVQGDGDLTVSKDVNGEAFYTSNTGGGGRYGIFGDAQIRFLSGSDIRVAGDLQPISASAYDLGTTALPWKDVIATGNVTATATDGTLYFENASQVLAVSTTAANVSSWTGSNTSHVIANTSAGTLTVPLAGRYMVNYSLSFDGAASQTESGYINVNNTKTNYQWRIATPVGETFASCAGVVDLAANDVVHGTVELLATSGNITIRSGQLSVMRLN